MSEQLIPTTPNRPLIWTDFVLDLQDALFDKQQEVYIVGGAVRDAYLHRPIKDVDLATPHNAVQLARYIADTFDGDVYVLDAERDIGRVLLDLPQEGRIMIDVARFRGGDLLADLIDRDFTFNAMAVDLHGDLGLLIDPLSGADDIENKLLRACTQHAIADDPIRALRAVRQSVQLGYRIEAETMQAIRRHCVDLEYVSPERIRDELFNIFSSDKPAQALRVANVLGVLSVIFPELVALSKISYQPFAENVWQHTLTLVETLHTLLVAISPKRTDNTAAAFGLGMLVIQLDRFRPQLQAHISAHWPNARVHQALLIFAALLHDAGCAILETEFERFSACLAAERADSLRLSKAEKVRVATVIEHHHRLLDFPVNPTALDIHRYWYQLGDAGIDVCLLGLSDYLATVGVHINQDEWLSLVDRVVILLDAYFNSYDQLVNPVLPIDGVQLIETLEIERGPIIGELLDYIREAQVSGDIHNAEDAINIAREYLITRGLK